jgi:curved DNA-binding protein
MENFRNYYELLGVERNSAPDEIKKAFRRLARQYHPDLNQGDKSAEEKFKEFNEAYRVLSDPSARSQYDQFTRFWRGKKNRNNQDFWSGSRADEDRNDSRSKVEEDFSQFGDFNSFIDQLLGRRSKTNSYNRGAEELGSNRRGRTSTVEPTADFRDESFPKSAPPRPKNVEAELLLPLEKAYQGGRERIKLEDGRSLEVDMPAGMVPGHKIRLRGQGIANGDLFLKIDVAPHQRFRLVGTDVHCVLPVTPAEAILGGFVEVPTLDGLVKISLPAGITVGQKLRLASKGFPDESGKRGDQLLEIQVSIPKTVSQAERDLYEKIRSIETFNPRLDDAHSS